VGGSINAEERTRDVVVVGASAGGIQAITELLSGLPADLPAAIGVVYESRVGVVLSGGGQDGLKGLLDVKAAGGIALAQKPSEAQVSSMPDHAIVGAQIDAVLTLDEIGAALVPLASGSAVQLRCLVDGPTKP
jgi:chemotaxis response regulator CheB